ncbi:MAG: hypothetical protein ABI608_06900 [Rhizomicrobium sp.]
MTSRNRAIFAEHLAGKTAAQLAQDYALTRASVVAIVTFEKHRLDVSADGFYEQLRASLGIPLLSIDGGPE